MEPMMLTVGSVKLEINDAEMEAYLSRLYGKPVTLLKTEKLGEGFHNAGFRLTFQIEGAVKAVVMRVVRRDTGWGHDYLGDRAAVLLLQHRLLNLAPRGTSTRSVDVAAVLADGSIASVGSATEFFHLVEEVTEQDGRPYSEDLFAIARRRTLAERDKRRCLAAARYLAELHSVKARNDHLYRRHIRDLVGHGEMLMGVADSYPDPARLTWTSRAELAQIEVKAAEWRNRLKYLTHRLCRIHGDYHPFGNIRFRADDTLLALDQSREEFGEPADDVSSLTINYIFFSVWHLGEYTGPFEELCQLFFQEYLQRTSDMDLLAVLPPFYAFRGLVVVHPVYYPDVADEKRRMMMNFIRNVLNEERFEPTEIRRYLTTKPR
ncbi:MAG: phosphotransferase [Candidatus Bathyarchaeia archaeon]